MHKKSQAELRSEINEAAAQVKVGGQYRHYKDRDKIYKVLNLAVIEADNQICVIYQAQYGERIVFVRPLDNWLSKVEWQGSVLNRFSPIDSYSI